MLISHSARISFADRVRRFFGGMPPHVQAAALAWRERNGGIEVLLITSRGSGRWVLPKGWPEQEERLFETALREAREEAGVVGEVSPVEAGRYFYGKKLSSGLERRCEVHVYPLRVVEEEHEWPESAERQRRWLPLSQAARLVDEPDLGELISGFTDNPARS